MLITKLIFVQTGTYNEQYLRPYQTNVTADVVGQFQEATYGGTDFSRSALSGVAGNMLQPKAQHEGEIFIHNGWNEPRLRFLMEVQHEERMSSNITQILSGYTDFLGASPSGAIAPEMRLFFNSVVTMRNIIEMTPLGRQARSAVAEASHLLRPDRQPSAWGSFNQPMTKTMRPEDIFGNMQHVHLNEYGSDIVDMRSAFVDTGLKKSQRSNSLASSYLSKVMRSYKSALGYCSEDAPEQVLNEARSNTREGLVSRDPFFSQARRNLGDQLQENGSLTFSELQLLDPSLAPNDDRIMVVIGGNTHQTSYHQTGQTEHWGGSNLETVAASILSQAVPALMMDLMLTKIRFMVTNETTDGSINVVVTNAASFSDKLNLAEFIELFKNRLSVEVMRDITQNNLMTTMLEMDVDVIGDTYIRISMNGQPMIDYVTPSFCDSLIAPVLTRDDMTLKTVASDIDQLIGNVTTHSYDTPDFDLGGV